MEPMSVCPKHGGCLFPADDGWCDNCGRKSGSSAKNLCIDCALALNQCGYFQCEEPINSTAASACGQSSPSMELDPLADLGDYTDFGFSPSLPRLVESSVGITATLSDGTQAVFIVPPFARRAIAAHVARAVVESALKEEVLMEATIEDGGQLRLQIRFASESPPYCIDPVFVPAGSWSQNPA